MIEIAYLLTDSWWNSDDYVVQIDWWVMNLQQIVLVFLFVDAKLFYCPCLSVPATRMGVDEYYYFLVESNQSQRTGRFYSASSPRTNVNTSWLLMQAEGELGHEDESPIHIKQKQGLSANVENIRVKIVVEEL